MKYNVGDKVRIKSLDWYNENKDEDGYIDCGDKIFDNYMSVFCESVVTIGGVYPYGYEIREDRHCRAWTDEMIEGLVEEKIGTALNPIEPKSNANCLTMERVDETKPEPKFKVGDKVKWYNHTCNIKSIDTDENTYTYLIKYDDYWEDATFAKWVPENELTFEDDEETKPIDFTIKATDTKGKVEVVIPEGYGYVVENDKLYFITKKKEYPKTYMECCDVLSIPSYYKLRYYTYVHNYNEYTTSNKLCSLQDKLNILGKLIICRDAYWKIAGEEMGLGKPWEPDWGDGCYVIITIKDKIQCGGSLVKNYLLAFPTEEMRDAFYENFKKDIEICKELL